MPGERSSTLEAFLHFFATFSLARQPSTYEDLADGTVFHVILSTVDPEYFGNQNIITASPPPTEWVDRLGYLKRVYQLLMQYFGKILQQSTDRLDVPDLQAIAKDYSLPDILLLCKLTIAATVQSDRKKEVIDRIQSLSEDDQGQLMKAIEHTLAKMNRQSGTRTRLPSMTDDDRYYMLQSERNRALREKAALEEKHHALIQDHQSLQGKVEDMTAERDEALGRITSMRQELDDKRKDRADASMRAEIDHLRSEVQKGEENLAVAETELEKQTSIITDLTHRVEELEPKAEEAVRLKDQVDELRHASERLHKTENVMEKYKKKLEESADMRRRIKSLEEQNSSLVDKNASLEEDYRKVSSYKPLVDSYKAQVGELEDKLSSRNKEVEALKFDFEQTKTQLKISAAERAKDREALELYQERVQELELMGGKTPKSPVSSGDGSRVPPTGNMSDMTEAELLGGDEDRGLSGELEDALSGTTMTDLKLQIRKLKLDLKAAQANKADSSRIIVLENLLEDANRMKARYEQDYLAIHRENLLLQSNLEEIRNGKSLGNGAEAAIALRQRLNETVDSLDSLKKEHTELTVRFESQAKELTIAKSDLHLVNKDQLDILSTLRASVNEDKIGLEADIERLKSNLKELSEKNRMQLDQVNTLLMDKVTLQTEGIGQRERMLDRERDFNDFRSSISGKDIPEDIKSRLLNLHEENVQLKEYVRTGNEKLLKAKAFIKNQDQLFKAEAATKLHNSSPAALDELENAHRMQIKSKEDELQKLRRDLEDLLQRYHREQKVLLGIVHKSGIHTLSNHLEGQLSPQPTSWLKKQRATLGQPVQRRIG